MSLKALFYIAKIPDLKLKTSIFSKNNTRLEIEVNYRKFAYAYNADGTQEYDSISNYLEEIKSGKSKTGR